jgi:hypothetical protein
VSVERPWRWPESNRLRQRLQGAPATLAVTPLAGFGIICLGLPFSWCSRYGRVNYPACTRGFSGRSIRPEVNENRPGGAFSRAAAGECLLALTRQPRRRPGQPKAAAPDSCIRVASAPGERSYVYGKPMPETGQLYFPGRGRSAGASARATPPGRRRPDTGGCELSGWRSPWYGGAWGQGGNSGLTEGRREKTE